MIMIKNKSVLLLICIIVFGLLSCEKNEHEVINYIDVLWKTSLGTDGRFVAYPSDWKTSLGTDGRFVAYPPDWKTILGTDGRFVAYPLDWKTSLGTDGRFVAYPSDWKTSLGTDGRFVAYPPDWETSLGTDGRFVAYPVSWKAGESIYLEDLSEVLKYVLVNTGHYFDLSKTNEFQEYYLYLISIEE
jgi:hypothetical protein